MPMCRSCGHDAGSFGKNPKARHACSFDPKDGKVRSINWLELDDAFVITHANGHALPKSDWIKTPRGHETQFNSFLLRCPRERSERDRKMDMREMMAEAHQRHDRRLSALRNGQGPHRG